MASLLAVTAAAELLAEDLAAAHSAVAKRALGDRRKIPSFQEQSV